MKEMYAEALFHLSLEQRAFIELIFKDMHPMLMNYARCGLNSREQAEEAVQDTFLKACAYPDKLMGSENPKGWMVRTLQNVMKEMYRKRDRMRDLVASESERSKAVHYDDYFETEYADILAPDEFALIRRLKVDHYSVREAAEELGISEEACKKRSQRAMDKLRRKLGSI